MTDEAAVTTEVTSGQTETSQPAPETTPAATETATPTPTAETKPAPTIDETIRQVYDKHNRPRNERGQFAPFVASTEETPVETPVEETTVQPEAAAEEPAKPAIPAPMSWTGEMKAKFSQLPPDVQTYVAQRDKESHEAISRAGQQIKAFEPIGKVLGQFRDTFERNNLHPAEAVARLLAVEANMEKDPVATIKQVAEAYGVDLRALTGQQQENVGDQPAPDPRIEALEAQNNELRQQLGQVTRYLQGQHSQQQNAGREALARQISSFAEAKDASGNLLHPHLDRVSGTMAALMNSDPNLDLEQAYNRAVRSDDELFAQAEAEKAKAAEVKRLAEARKKAEEAKKAAALNVTSTPASGKTPRTMDETLREAALKAYGR